ncbi:MAG: hypothetical protein PPP56_03215 [Longimonas sp.]|uniref:transcriptional regulator/antitoxin MazE n=1 Tax=Longimonas sp. TaxID=2039626 RepID=UPI00335B579B
MKRLTLKKIEDSLGIILSDDAVKALDAKEGDTLFAVPTADGLHLTLHDPEEADALEDAQAFMDTHDDAFRKLA